MFLTCALGFSSSGQLSNIIFCTEFSHIINIVASSTLSWLIHFSVVHLFQLTISNGLLYCSRRITNLCRKSEENQMNAVTKFKFYGFTIENGSLLCVLYFFFLFFLFSIFPLFQFCALGKNDI